MERAEEIILGLKEDNPLCLLTLGNSSATVKLEQSLELTWSGSTSDCRALLEFMFPGPRPNLEFIDKHIVDEKQEGDVFHARAEWEDTWVEVDIRGEHRQLIELMSAFIQVGGPAYFDRAVHDRRTYG